eukprot:TRINITY_DN1114_c0_g2_i2.p2 TRINITY_DN1114_c0_g2~~TRINITY_DN1114_c0_g2_i2.p2  ORF type:complete len:166 (+),score=60.21 TRINITY_DN1114_c0_g2_i2:39-536(+)
MGQMSDSNDPSESASNRSDPANRKTTFLAFPNAPSHSALIDKLVEAGFYCEPNSKAKDRTVCFSCGLTLCDWEHGDDPLQLHYKRKPECAHIAKLFAEGKVKTEPQEPMHSIDEITNEDLKDIYKLLVKKEGGNEEKRKEVEERAKVHCSLVLNSFLSTLELSKS